MKNEKPSIILLDIMLPGVDGKTICKEIRKFSEVPVLMITAKVEEVYNYDGYERTIDFHIKNWHPS